MGFFACNIFCFMGLQGNRGRGGVNGKFFEDARAAIGLPAHHSEATLRFAAIFSAKRVSGVWRGA